MTKSSPITRRRFLSVCASAAAFSAVPWVTALASAPLHHWTGILMGAEVKLSLAHPDKASAEKIFKTCVQEIQRLENIFTLYDSHSELSRLNSNGSLENPSPEMLDILKLSRHYHEQTGGAFDITVGALERSPQQDLTGMDKLEIEEREISLSKPGMALTLNGIAQGYITDRITELLKNEGLNNVLVELGEKRAVGTHPSGRPWNIALSNHEEIAELQDKALASSSAIDPDGRAHIYNPAGTNKPIQHQHASVIAETAAMADAFSTAFIIMKPAAINTLQKNMPDLHQAYLKA